MNGDELSILHILVTLSLVSNLFELLCVLGDRKMKSLNKRATVFFFETTALQRL